ncbi:hypothetical protein ONE63_003335 [Megalurothrips usitatus]|uniref:UDP-glucuronosyltransferase n=1 Tax=Megalurothrips usitatus TaxID=439358 RepID=A0AAV7XBF5_9NEOP|nr:hypothetical protein ONE63_003335 [Megalurothrips usitatus]
MAVLLRTLALLAAVAAVPEAAAFRVLGFFPFNAPSHNIMLKATMEALADYGHEVVMLSPFPLKKPRANYTDLDISKELPSLANTLTFEEMTALRQPGIMRLIVELGGAHFCRAVFQMQHFRDIMSGKHGKFDVVFTEICNSDCWTAVAHKLDVPLISISTQPDLVWQHERVGSVNNPSYLPVNFEPYVGRLTFPQRLFNTAVYIYYNWAHKFYVQWPSDEVVREFFGEDTPPISELLQRTSLTMINAHVSINPARPIPPNVINVAGIHLKPDPTGRGLDPELRRWMDEAEHGVIYFSLGSLVPSSSLPRATVLALVEAFRAVPQRVLWKYETDDIKDLLPPNVRTAKWLPQANVLAHHKTVLFITHGGLMGTTEAIVLGVPMLGIPLFADQMSNIALYKSLGIAESADHRAITKDSVLAAIRKVTATDEYRVRSRELAARYLDRPQTAAESAVWWTEYVVRHRGARHLRPVGADMPLYQYLLLDVAAVVLAAAAAALLLLRSLLRALLGLLPPPPRRKEKRL